MVVTTHNLTLAEYTDGCCLHVARRRRPANSDFPRMRGRKNLLSGEHADTRSNEGATHRWRLIVSKRRKTVKSREAWVVSQVGADEPAAGAAVRRTTAMPSPASFAALL